MNTLKLLSTCIILILFAGCSISKSNGKEQGQTPDQTDLLIKWMSGTFSSTEQARTDKTYYDIILHMYPIWIDRSDGKWLYVEQAVMSRQNAPYRQRVYHVKRDNERYMSRVYELPNPEIYIGKWIGGTEWDRIGPEDLIEREGCTVFLDYTGEAFVGSTENNSCSSTLRGAAYATSEVNINKYEIRSWDRGFDVNGQQVWGAEGGPYIFRPFSDVPD